MRKIIAIIALALSLSSCSAQENPMAAWEKTANLTAAETPEQLYAAALQEDTLVVYSTSSRVIEAGVSYEKQYPGLTVRVDDMRENNLYEKLEENFAAGEYGCDVVLSADRYGVMENEYLPQGIIYKYAPYDIAGKMLTEGGDGLFMISSEATMLFYNDDYYAKPPVSNWWELTEERWRGQVMMPNPGNSTTAISALSMFMERADDMAAAYETLYGTPLELPFGENAGEVFIRKLFDNDLRVVNYSDEIVETIGSPAEASPMLGITVSSKLRMKSLGYHIACVPDAAPFSGALAPIHVMIASGAKNINAAKLFIRWLVGETDGTGEGYKPYLQTGSWSMRSDVTGGMAETFEELNLIYPDRDYTYENREKIENFWVKLMEEKQAEAGA